MDSNGYLLGISIPLSMSRYVFFSAIFLWSLQAIGQESSQITLVDLVTFKNTITNAQVQLIDVRTHKEYNEGFITYAKNIPIARRKKFKKEVSKLDRQKAIYVYCYSGVRSRRASKILKRLGFQKIVDFKGGWKEWKENQK